MTSHRVCQSQFPLPNIPISGFMESPRRQTHLQAAWTLSQPSKGGGQASPQPQPPHTAWSDPPEQGATSGEHNCYRFYLLPCQSGVAAASDHPACAPPASQVGVPTQPPPSTPHAGCRRELAAPELPKPLALACLGALQLRNPLWKPGRWPAAGLAAGAARQSPPRQHPRRQSSTSPSRGGYTPEGREG